MKRFKETILQLEANLLTSSDKDFINIINELKKTESDDYEYRQEILNQHGTLVGKGSARWVYKFHSNKAVIKLAISPAGIAQNKTEQTIMKDSEVNSILPKEDFDHSDKDCKWIIVEAVTPLDYHSTAEYDKFKKVLGITIEELNHIMYFAESESSINETYHIFNEKYPNLKLESKKFIITLHKLIKKYNMEFNEFEIIEQYGIKNNKLYCIDFGMDKETSEKHYPR